MENQHRKIAGYRELNAEEIELMNAGKQLEASWNSFIDLLRDSPHVDQRQVSIAATDGESAFMRAIRSIARPERIVAVKLSDPRARQ